MKPAHKMSSDKVAAITPDFHWLPIDSTTPRGAKMLLISKKAGVAHIALYNSADTFYTHWAPLPTFLKETT